LSENSPVKIYTAQRKLCVTEINPSISKFCIFESYISLCYLHAPEIKVSRRKMNIVETNSPIFYPDAMHIQSAFGKVGILQTDFSTRKYCVA
jgi:hypothetical protein